MDIFSGLKSFFKTNVTTIDNCVFRLHYKVSALFLVAFSILVTSKQYIGDPIDCISSTNDRDLQKFIDVFCWIHTTYSLPDAWSKKVGVDIIYPGVDNATPGVKKVYHAYYQWVCFVLFLQAVLFYIPRYFWKAMEGGKIKNLILGLNSPVLSEEVKTSNRKLLVQYMTRNLRHHSSYFNCFVLAEIANFANIVGQIYLIDKFLGGEFSRYGIKVIQFTEWDWSIRDDPMIRVFPRITKCDFYNFGRSGSIQSFDAMCLLPINIINEKIYVFLWFWFVILAVLSAAVLVYRLITILSPNFRLLIMQCRAPLTSHDDLKMIVNKCGLGDWLILHFLCKNLEPLNFREVVSDFARHLEE